MEKYPDVVLNNTIDIIVANEKHVIDEINTNKKRIIEIPRGFRDFHPDEMIIRKKMFAMIELSFQLHGAQTIDTPILELKEVLFEKYGDQEKLVFDITDNGGRPCSMRYDLTVPFARYMAQHGKVHMKRYHIGQVFRRDTPNISKGRYRSFYQLDFDIAGEYDRMIPDAEVINVMIDILDKFDINFTVKFNHRAIIDIILLDLCNVPKDKFIGICSTIDKLDKQSWAEVVEEMKEKGLENSVIENIKSHVMVIGKPNEILHILFKKYSFNEAIMKTLNDIKLLFDYLDAFGCLNKLTFDLSLMRGLSYYTGVIFEAVLCDNENSIDSISEQKLELELGLGSIAAGGRYDNLIGIFCNKHIPSVGCSIGVERLFTIIDARNKKQNNKIIKSNTQVYVTHIGGDNMLCESLKLAKKLWSNGIITEIPYKNQKRMADKIEGVLKLGIPLMILVAENEFANQTVIVKDLFANNGKGTQHLVNIDVIVEFIKSKLIIQ